MNQWSISLLAKHVSDKFLLNSVAQGLYAALKEQAHMAWGLNI